MTLKTLLDEDSLIREVAPTGCAYLAGSATSLGTMMTGLYGLLYKLPEVTQINQAMSGSPVLKYAIDMAHDHPLGAGLAAVTASLALGLVPGYIVAKKTYGKMKKVLESKDDE